MSKQVKIPSASKMPLDDAIAAFIKAIKSDKMFQSNFAYIREKKERLENFIQEGKSPIGSPPNVLVVLRKWNSYTPILPPTNEEYANKGGGYFLRIRDRGIVIDPGYNFVENYLRAGFKLDDIDHILISHAHNDHTVELEGIFSLLFKRNKDSKNPKRIKLYMNLGTFKKYSGYFDLSNLSKSAYIDDIVLLNRHQWVKLDEAVELFTTQVKHHEMITKDYALGFTFILKIDNEKKRILKFTCDTGWSSELEKENKKGAEAFNIDKTDILIAHIGSIKEKELDYDTKKTLRMNERRKKLYENHLGLIGCAAAIHYWKPDLVLLSEFGEELNAIRHKIAETLGQILKIPVFATDLNFRVDLDTLQMMCFKTREFYLVQELKTYYKGAQLFILTSSKLSPSEEREIDSHLGSKIKVFD